jgi:hypothetical protein
MRASPLGILLLIAAIYPIVKSPKRSQTLGRMVIALLATILLIVVPTALLGIGDPQAWGQIAGLVGLLVAVIAGWWHTRSLKGVGAPSAAGPAAKS